MKRIIFGILLTIGAAISSMFAIYYAVAGYNIADKARFGAIGGNPSAPLLDTAQAWCLLALVIVAPLAWYCIKELTTNRYPMSIEEAAKMADK